MTIDEPKLRDKQIGEKIQITTNSVVTLPQPYLNSTISKINYTNEVHADILLEMEENPFLTIEQ